MAMEDDDIEQSHLEWTKKQGYVLTGGGKAESFYTPERGFPFLETDLPHYHLLQGDTHDTFQPDPKASQELFVAGAWNRSLFSGGWKYSSDKEERVYNLQTNNLFVDFRVPRSRERVLGASKARSLQELGAQELRLYARQHIFAGVTVLDYEEKRPVATRHHFIDWNFIGVPRPRPNKWWIEANDDVSSWKEFAYATDDNGQNYYFEQWDRLEDGLPEPRLALRIFPPDKQKQKASSTGEGETERPSSCAKTGHVPNDGVFVLAGDHFNYVTGRNFSGNESSYDDATSLVDLVDDAVNKGDLATARSYLSIEGGHGLVSSGWKLDCAIPPWNEGEDIASVGNSNLEVIGTDLATCHILWKGLSWDVYDCSFENVDDLKQFLSENQVIMD